MFTCEIALYAYARVSLWKCRRKDVQWAFLTWNQWHVDLAQELDDVHCTSGSRYLILILLKTRKRKCKKWCGLKSEWGGSNQEKERMGSKREGWFRHFWSHSYISCIGTWPPWVDRAQIILNDQRMIGKCTSAQNIQRFSIQGIIDQGS